MDLYDYENTMVIAPDGEGGWTVNSRGELEGWIRRSGEQLEFAHVDAPETWHPAGTSISEVRDSILAHY